MTVFTVILFFAVGLIGLTHIIVDSKILSGWREEVRKNETPFLGYKLHDMVTCHQCAGFWVGLFGWPWALPYLPIEWSVWKVLCLPAVAVLSACAISLLSVGARSLIDWLTLNVQIPEELWNEQQEETE